MGSRKKHKLLVNKLEKIVSRNYEKTVKNAQLASNCEIDLVGFVNDYCDIFEVKSYDNKTNKRNAFWQVLRDWDFISDYGFLRNGYVFTNKGLYLVKGHELLKVVGVVR